MIENTATYDFLIEIENQTLNHSFQRKIRTAKIQGGAGSDVEEDLDRQIPQARLAIDLGGPDLCAREEEWPDGDIYVGAKAPTNNAQRPRKGKAARTAAVQSGLRPQKNDGRMHAPRPNTSG